MVKPPGLVSHRNGQLRVVVLWHPADRVPTRAVWQPYYREVLTDEQAVELLILVGVFYEILFSGERERDDSSDCAKPR